MLEEKLDLLTKELVALRKAVEANTAAGGATANTGGGKASTGGDDEGESKPRGRGRPKKEEATPDHDKDEVEEIIRKVSREVGKPVAKKIITSFKCEDLADLLTHPEHFDAAFAKAEEALSADNGEEEDDI